MRFTYQQPASRIVFGADTVRRVGDEANADRVALIMSKSATAAGQLIGEQLGERLVAMLDTVVQHVPDELARDAVDRVQQARAETLVCVGGGSATGLAKAVAATLRLPIVAVPTTYAGSELTPIYGITGEHKVTRRDPAVQPRTVLYDPLLTLGLPAHQTACSGLNAVAHAIAAATSSSDATPPSTLHALEAIRVLRTALPAAVRDGADRSARSDALYGAYLAGSAVAITGTGLHHRLCHLIGGDFNLVHAEVHATLLPYTVAYGQRSSGEFAAVADALGAADPATGVRELAAELGAPTSLAAIGLPPGAVTALELPDDVSTVLNRAYQGDLAPT